jgi:hypothetical protein
MKRLGTFPSARWGTVTVMQSTYEAEDGPTAIMLHNASGEKLTNLSVNMYPPECQRDSRELARDCFYVKTWDSPELVAEALASGLFRARPDLPECKSGYVSAPAWQLVDAGGMDVSPCSPRPDAVAPAETCICCRKPFEFGVKGQDGVNVWTEAGQREAAISKLCEACWDETFAETDEEDQPEGEDDAQRP